LRRVFFEIILRQTKRPGYLFRGALVLYNQMEKVDAVVVGAGVVGLAVAQEVSRLFPNVLVIERHAGFGQETSSRNSEVIHAGIYYPKDSLKARTCVEGRALLYEFCLKNNIPHKRLGKLIVANTPAEIKKLEELFKAGLDNGVSDLELIDEKKIRKLEPNIRAKAAIYSPSTGIIDTHSFMQALSWFIKKNQATIAYNTELIRINPKKHGFEITVRDTREGDFVFLTRILINSAGLNSDKISALAGLDKPEYKIKYCKGDYFRLKTNKSKFVYHLVYPVPLPQAGGLGIHVTLDLTGSVRLGPDDEYVDKIFYDVDSNKAGDFCKSAKEILPFIDSLDLEPDIAGIRPKLQGPNEDFRDFIIKDEKDQGLFGLINLIGIESPGLTASLSIARSVKDLLKNYA